VSETEWTCFSFLTRFIPTSDAPLNPMLASLSIQAMSPSRVRGTDSQPTSTIETLSFLEYCQSIFIQLWEARQPNVVKERAKMLPCRPVSIWRSSYECRSSFPTAFGRPQCRKRTLTSLASFSAVQSGNEMPWYLCEIVANSDFMFLLTPSGGRQWRITFYISFESSMGVARRHSRP
jgi:hypothetical protein